MVHGILLSSWGGHSSGCNLHRAILTVMSDRRARALSILSTLSEDARVSRRSYRERVRAGMQMAVKSGATHREVAEACGLKRPTVTQILAGTRWAHQPETDI